MIRLGWFSTGRDEAARELLSVTVRKKREGFLDIDIAFVLCNWEEGEEEERHDRTARELFFHKVRELGIPLVTVSWKKFMPDLREKDPGSWRSEYGKAVRTALGPYPFDIGVMAGFKLWLDDETCRSHPLIEIYPALPGGPTGSWQEAIWELIGTRSDRHGATVHLCSPHRDKGMPLAYCSFAIRGPRYNALWMGYDAKVRGKGAAWIRKEEGESEPLFRHIRHDGSVREAPLLAHSIKLLADGKVQIKDECLYEGGEKLDRPYDLTKDVDRALQSGEFREA